MYPFPNLMLAPTNGLIRAGNELKCMHIEHCSLPHTLPDIKKQELDEKRYVLWPVTRKYSMSSNPVSQSLTEQRRKNTDFQNQITCYKKSRPGIVVEITNSCSVPIPFFLYNNTYIHMYKSKAEKMTALAKPLFQQCGDMIRFWAKDVTNVGFCLFIEKNEIFSSPSHLFTPNMGWNAEVRHL